MKVVSLAVHLLNRLSTGYRFDRYGYEGGSFTSPVGTPAGMRALAPGTTSKPYNIYEVVNPFEVQTGYILPWFDQPGFGIQHKFPTSVKGLIESGHIKRVTDE